MRMRARGVPLRVASIVPDLLRRAMLRGSGLGAALGQMLSFAVLGSATVFLLYFLLATERWLIARTIEAIPHRRTRALLLSGLRQAQRDIGLFITTMGLIS